MNGPLPCTAIQVRISQGTCSTKQGYLSRRPTTMFPDHDNPASTTASGTAAAAAPEAHNAGQDSHRQQTSAAGTETQEQKNDAPPESGSSTAAHSDAPQHGVDGETEHLGQGGHAS